MRRLGAALALLLACSLPAHAATGDHPTVLPPILVTAAQPARAFVGGLPAFDTCPTFSIQPLAAFRVYLSTVSPTDPGALAATLPITPQTPTVTWTCATPLAAGTYYLNLTLVDLNGVEGAHTVSVGFIIGTPPATFPLTLTTAGTGMGSVSGQGSYAPGAPVTLTAVPSPTSTFASWTPAPCAVTFTMPAAPLLCTATFTLIPPPPVIGIGSTVFVNTSVNQALNVRPGPTNAVPPSCAVCPTQPRGASGTVVAGPVVANGITWWQIDYVTGADGWSSGTYLSLTAP